MAFRQAKCSIRAITKSGRCKAPDGGVVQHNVIVADGKIGQASSVEPCAISAGQHPVHKGGNLLVHEVGKFVHGSESDAIGKYEFNQSGGHFFLRVAAGLRRVVGFFRGAAFFLGGDRLDVSAGTKRQQAVSAD